MSVTTPVIRRLRERAVDDRAALYDLLDEQFVGHAATVADGDPVVVPLLIARDGDTLLLHGSTGAGFVQRARAGGTIAVSVAAVDGLVYARSLFDSSMNYRSAVIYGVPEIVGPDEAGAALDALSERLMPGRVAEVRPSTRKELAATGLLRLPLEHWALKVRAHGASEEEGDGEDRGVWAGVLPLGRSWGVPQTSPLTSAGTPVAPSVLARAAGR
ncbi:pyridoxamine 5'-phosphate oxidase family protein [Agromyces seonyuensis]|uniref:Pyridoxamine 5'-phosphate oxidase family protein n=1 Tax=Agromyces seonyuensis TaxID=2662446 RepID=A0A6I4P0U6_9MICO|nr:pyridoxamine 5'-phosphate oxidase family protein [Agromyces seonyuensis]MWB99981.1 pyridoxamine 5'-phosphate oxidase family protein [Agromyces seonyuensis]